MLANNPFDTGYFHSDQLRSFGFQSVGNHVRIAKNCTIVGLINISIGNNVRIDGPSVISANSGFCHIGSYVHIAGGCFLLCGAGVTLEDYSGLSQGVKLYSTSDDYSGTAMTNPTLPVEFTKVKMAPVHLRKHVIVGSGSVVLPGVELGEGVALGALSLASKSLPAWGMYSGVPARKIRTRSSELLEYEARLGEIR